VQNTCYVAMQSLDASSTYDCLDSLLDGAIHSCMGESETHSRLTSTQVKLRGSHWGEPRMGFSSTQV